MSLTGVRVPHLARLLELERFGEHYLIHPLGCVHCKVSMEQSVGLGKRTQQTERKGQGKRGPSPQAQTGPHVGELVAWG